TPIVLIDMLIFILLILAIIIGIRSVGVVLMAGMLIAPSVAARQFSNCLKHIFIMAAMIGACSGFFGNYLSIEIPEWGKRQGWDLNLVLPTGSIVLLFSAVIFFFSLLVSPKSGLFRRMLRAAYFQRECQRENLLKYLWKKKEHHLVSHKQLKHALGLS